MTRSSLARLLAVSLLLLTAASPMTASSGPDTAGRYIVVFRDEADAPAAQARARERGVVPVHTYGRAIKGFSATLSTPQLAALRSDPAVAFVEADRVVRLAGQQVPTGVNRVEADATSAAAIDGVDSRVDADVAIIDTGIWEEHQDLNVAGGVNCTDTAGTAPDDWNDGNGHGTHVAGTVGALDNEVGVVGVAPGARVWAVRVFRADGYSLLSWIVCGIDWVTAFSHPAYGTIEAANMSLRDEGSDDGNCGNTNGDAEHMAICRSVDAGIAYAVAAGNDGTTTTKWIPAAYDEVITVSALADFNGTGGGGAKSTCSSFRSADSDDTFADFSNYGADVDLIAPGKCIYSTYPTNKSTGTGYAVLSGTSMASPHVAGAIALYRAANPDATPGDVKAVLQAAGTIDWYTNTDPDAVHERLLNVSSLAKAADFSLAATPASASVGKQGGTAAYDIEAIRGNGFPGDISLAVTGAPAGTTVSLSSTVLTGLSGLSADLAVAVPRTTKAGTYVVTITGTSDGESRTVTVKLVKK